MKLATSFFRIALPLTVITLVLGQSTAVLADPLPGEVLKFQQLPLNNGGPPSTGGAPFPGHDEWSTANLVNGTTAYQGVYMADDFADKFNTPVVHVRWWGSYQNNEFGSGVKKFLISFESDVPAGADPNPSITWSHPGAPLLTEVVNLGPLAPASSTFTETPVATPGAAVGLPPPPEALFQYNAELDCPFPQQPDTVYWLKIVALVNPQQDGAINWGWHDRDWGIFDPLASTAPSVIPGEFDENPGPGIVWHFQDDAVQGSITTTDFPDVQPRDDATADCAPQNYVFPVDGPDGIQNFSKDLAFELYTVPEPASLALMGVGALARAAFHHKRRFRTDCICRSRRQQDFDRPRSCRGGADFRRHFARRVAARGGQFLAFEAQSRGTDGQVGQQLVGLKNVAKGLHASDRAAFAGCNRDSLAWYRSTTFRKPGCTSGA